MVYQLTLFCSCFNNHVIWMQKAFLFVPHGICALCAVTLSLNTSVLKYLIIFLPGKENCHLHLQMRKYNREILSPNIQRFWHHKSELHNNPFFIQSTEAVLWTEKYWNQLWSHSHVCWLFVQCFWRDVNKYSIINESLKKKERKKRMIPDGTKK